MLVHLVRHGEVDNPSGLVYGALPGFGLSEGGTSQARQAGRYLAHREVAAVYSSPLERALRTAEEIARPHRLVVRVEDDLIEWRHQRWTGLAWEALPRQRPGELEAYLDDPTHLHFVEETLDDLAARMVAVISRAAARAVGEVVVVGHQDPLQAARLRLIDLPLRDLHRDPPQHAEVITLEPARPWREVSRWRPPSQT